MHQHFAEPFKGKDTYKFVANRKVSVFSFVIKLNIKIIISKNTKMHTLNKQCLKDLLKVVSITFICRFIINLCYYNFT